MYCPQGVSLRFTLENKVDVTLVYSDIGIFAIRFQLPNEEWTEVRVGAREGLMRGGDPCGRPRPVPKSTFHMSETAPHPSQGSLFFPPNKGLKSSAQGTIELSALFPCMYRLSM